MCRPGHSGGDYPDFQTVGGLQHERRTLSTWLSSGTSAGTFTCSAGPYKKIGEAGKENELNTYFVLDQKELSENRFSRFEPTVWFISFSIV